VHGTKGYFRVATHIAGYTSLFIWYGKEYQSVTFITGSKSGKILKQSGSHHPPALWSVAKSQLLSSPICCYYTMKHIQIQSFYTKKFFIQMHFLHLPLCITWF